MLVTFGYNILRGEGWTAHRLSSVGHYFLGKGDITVSNHVDFMNGINVIALTYLTRTNPEGF